jgi:DNA-binding FadR family transcriptional regulator
VLYSTCINLINRINTKMMTTRLFPDHFSPFLQYLAARYSDGERLPSLVAISQDLGISVAALREQLEVARALGLVEVRPKTGVRRLPYTFRQAVAQSLGYATSIDEQNFQLFAELRNHIEASYWYQAVGLLTSEDHAYLADLVEKAEEKLAGDPPQTPHVEHRELHLSIYRRLNNPFVNGILEAYWESYEAIGLAVMNEYSYLRTVWQYHRKMVSAIQKGELDLGYHALIDHTDLLYKRPQPISRQKFE